MTYEQIEEEISSIPKFSPKASLPNLSAYLEKCNHPERKLRVIHVAGTNGKGSVCAFLESILRKSGYRTALFTSPHLVCIGERFRINFEMCTEEQLTGAWKTVRELMLTGESEGRKPLTYFEVLFLMSVLIFSEEKVDYCIMETGLGGRLDATVLCDPVLSVITSISLDHTEILGDTIEKIAAEKAGIIKTGVPVVAFDEENGAFPVLETEAKKKKTHIYKVRYENITILKKTENNIDFSINSSYYKCNLLSVSGIANYQIYNGALAATAAKILLPELCDEVIREGLYRGADGGYLLTDRAFAGADTLATSYALATAIKKINDYDIILGGRQAIDGDTAQVGPQVAEKLGLTQITYAEEILNVDEAARRITVKRHIDGGVETVEGPLPIVITVNGSAAPCRPRNAKLVMKYKRALGAQEKAAAGAISYPELYESRPYLNIPEWSVKDVDGDLAQCGLSGSPTKVKTVQNIVFQAKESKTLTGSDKDVEDLIVELLANHTIG